MKKYIVLLIVIVILLIVLLVIKKRRESFIMGDLESFELFYTQGYAYNADIRYKFFHKAKDNRYVVSKKPYGESEEETIVHEVDEEFQKELETILDKYKVSSWDGFNGNDKDVLDGDSFSLTIIYSIGTVHASGYMSYPKNYGSFKTDIINLFDNYFKNENNM